MTPHWRHATCLPLFKQGPDQLHTTPLTQFTSSFWFLFFPHFEIFFIQRFKKPGEKEEGREQPSLSWADAASTEKNPSWKKPTRGELEKPGWSRSKALNHQCNQVFTGDLRSCLTAHVCLSRHFDVTFLKIQVTKIFQAFISAPVENIEPQEILISEVESRSSIHGNN